MSSRGDERVAALFESCYRLGRCAALAFDAYQPATLWIVLRDTAPIG